MPDIILFGPESEPFNTYAAAAPAPGTTASVVYAGGPPAIRGVRPDGTQLVMQDGRKFRFARAGGSTLVVGDALTAGVATPSQQNLTAAAGAVGDRFATMTTGASTAANVFAQGFLVVSVTPGGGDTYKIANHLLMTAGAGDIVNFWPGFSLRTALTTTSRLDLIDSPYSRVIQSPASTVASCPVGVAVSAPTTLRGCWIQTRGPVGVLTSGTAIAGDAVSTGLGTGGAMGPIADNAQDTQPGGLAWCILAAASGAWSTMFLTIDG
jgi:hypothetical protein